MNKILRWYYNNRLKFWRIVLIVVSAYLLLLLLNSFSKNNLKEATTNKNIVKTNYTNKTTIKSESSIVGTSVNSKNLQKANTIIDNFVDYCNNNEIEKAYNLLSNNCKEVLFPTLENFKINYYNNIFKKDIDYVMQNWSGNTYKIEYRESLLSTGGKKTEEFIRDYITIVNNNNDVKININNYIGRKELDRTKTVGNIKIKILSKDIYMDYEKYNFLIENNSKNDAILDNLEYSTNIFLTDENNVKYYAYANELTNDLLTVKVNQKKELSIKFTNSYITNRKYSSINFTKFIETSRDKENTKTVEISL